jgi:hypothetical protein
MRKVPLVRGAVAHHELLHALQVYHQGVPLTASGLKYEFWPFVLGSPELFVPASIPLAPGVAEVFSEAKQLLQDLRE